MALREDAKFEFGPVFWRLMAKNPDGSVPTPSRIVGGVGPFDFSSAESEGAVPVTVKIDNANEIATTVDLTASADISAVTVAEFVTAWGLAAAAATGITASLETSTGRIKFAKTTSPLLSTYMQIYGEVGRTLGLGFGKGVKLLKSDNQKSIADAPSLKASERLETVDTKGLATAVVTNALRQGTVLTLTEASADPEIREVIEGGTYDAVSGQYIVPTPDQSRDAPRFYLETFNAVYTEGDHPETGVDSYKQRIYRECQGSFGNTAGARGFDDQVFTINASPYRDPTTNDTTGDTIINELTVAEFEALNVETV